jgi:hypothetical protein
MTREASVEALKSRKRKANSGFLQVLLITQQLGTLKKP